MYKAPHHSCGDMSVQLRFVFFRGCESPTALSAALIEGVKGTSSRNSDPLAELRDLVLFTLFSGRFGQKAGRAFLIEVKRSPIA